MAGSTGDPDRVGRYKQYELVWSGLGLVHTLQVCGAGATTFTNMRRYAGHWHLGRFAGEWYLSSRAGFLVTWHSNT